MVMESYISKDVGVMKYCNIMHIISAFFVVLNGQFI